MRERDPQGWRKSEGEKHRDRESVRARDRDIETERGQTK